MKDLIARQTFDIVDGNPVFKHCAVVFRRDGYTYSAKSPHRQVTSSQDLQNIKLIPPEAYQPHLPEGALITEDPARFYVKMPDLSAFNSISTLIQPILQDLAAYENIRKHPYPNLAQYQGYVVSSGRVTGLCFTRYPQSLISMVNPGHYNKTEFIGSVEIRGRRARAAQYLDSIEQGLRHLHALSFIHNDLNPSNIMITEEDTPIIIDFDSATIPGVSIKDAKRTHGWFNRQVIVSRESNDLDTLAEIRV